VSLSVEVHHGRAAAFHERVVPPGIGRAAWIHHVTVPAIVLGSAEPIEHVDLPACERLGVDVVRRRSGGGAVHLQPGTTLWVDVIVPRDDPHWDDDVGRAGYWIGDAWRDALGAGSVHRGPMITTEWSRQVCFAGVGPGEVVSDGAKLVGISQRRTRHHARFQCAVYSAWDVDALVAVLAVADRAAARRALADVARPVSFAGLAERFLTALDDDGP
jgi:lipoate-protein ligase A